MNEWVSQSVSQLWRLFKIQEILAHLKIGVFIYPSHQNKLYHTQLLNKNYKIWGLNNRQKLWDNPVKQFSKVVFPRNTVDCVDYVDSVIFTLRRHDHDHMTDTGSRKIILSIRNGLPWHNRPSQKPWHCQELCGGGENQVRMHPCLNKYFKWALPM